MIIKKQYNKVQVQGQGFPVIILRHTTSLVGTYQFPSGWEGNSDKDSDVEHKIYPILPVCDMNIIEMESV